MKLGKLCPELREIKKRLEVDQAWKKHSRSVAVKVKENPWKQKQSSV